MDTNKPGLSISYILHLRPAKTQINLRIRAVWSESLLSAWRRFGPLVINRARSEDIDQTARMRRLFWVFARRTCNLLGHAVPLLKYSNKVSYPNSQENSGEYSNSHLYSITGHLQEWLPAEWIY